MTNFPIARYIADLSTTSSVEGVIATPAPQYHPTNTVPGWGDSDAVDEACAFSGDVISSVDTLDLDCGNILDLDGDDWMEYLNFDFIEDAKGSNFHPGENVDDGVDGVNDFATFLGDLEGANGNETMRTGAGGNNNETGAE